MPLVQETTDWIENLILNHDVLKEEASKEIRNASSKQDAADNIKTRFDTWFLNEVAEVVLEDDGVTPKFTRSKSTVQNALKNYLDQCDWFFLVDKYWDTVRSS